MTDNDIRVGVIGTSKRAAWYFRRVPSDLRRRVRIVGLADPDESKRARFQHLLCNGYQPLHFSNGAAMLADLTLDALVIASPNKFHAADAERALSMGIATLLEKPVAISLAECRQLWRAQRSSALGELIVGFVLRYTPFYSKVKEVIDSGGVGDVLAIEADEMLGTALTVGFHKGWRRYDDLSGGFIVEKCSHDFDILNWLIGAEAQRVFSIGHRTHFKTQPLGGKRYSRYDTVNQPRHSSDYGDNQLREAFFVPSDRSPYDVSADSPDHQTVMVEYAQGTICTVTACMGQPRTTRSLRVFGTDGSLEGDIGHSRIRVYRPHSEGDGHDVEEISVEHDTSGHHGGDSAISESFWRAVSSGSMDQSRAGLQEGIEAVLIGLAAEQSRRSGQPTDLRALRSDVYRAASGETSAAD